MFVANCSRSSLASKIHRCSLYTFKSSKSLQAPKKDFYTTLGISKNATQTEIKHSYYKLAQTYHPDKNSAANAKDKFAEINMAYETLSDESKRSVYDNYGLTGDEQDQASAGGDPFADFFGGGGRRGAGAGFSDFGFDSTIFEDFDSFFSQGHAQAQKHPKKGADIFLNIELDFNEVINGVQKEVKYNRQATCSTCDGKKSAPGSKPQKCGTCSGKGHIHHRQGPIVIEMACGKCKGVGSIIKNPCNTCRGKGVTHLKHVEQIRVPKGVENGQNIRIKGKGNCAQDNGLSGDLIIKVTAKSDSYFRRNGSDVHTDVYISISQAALGSTMTVETLYGPQKIQIEKGTQHGDTLKLQNMGISRLSPNNHQKGDHHIQFRVVIPKKMSAEETSLFRKLSEIEESINQVEYSKQNPHKFTAQEDKRQQPNQNHRKARKNKKHQEEEYEDEESDDEEFDEHEMREAMRQMFSGGRHPF